LSTPARRADLAALLAADPRFEAERARCVARFIAGLSASWPASWPASRPANRPQGSRPALYGCGGLGRRLAREHADALRRAGAVFVATRPEADNFEGFPLHSPENLPEHCGPALLLSATYAGEMRAALPEKAAADALDLARVLRESACAEDLLPLERAMDEAADALARRMAAEVPRDRPLACFLLSNFGTHAPQVLAGVQGAGWRVAVLTHAGLAPGAEEDMRARGQLDLLHAEPSAEALRLVLGSLLAKGRPFAVVHAWTSFSNHGFLADLARAGVPLVAGIDAALPPLFQGGSFGTNLCAELGTSREELLADWRALYTLSAGIVSKDSPALDAYFERELDARPRRMLHQLPPVGPAPAKRAGSPKNGPVRVVFIGSLHTSARREDLFNIPDFVDIVRQFTARGIALTAINNLDGGTGAGNGHSGGWDGLRALAEEEPLFEYRPRVPFEELPQTLSGFHFGLLWHHPRLSARLPLTHATNLQTKLCAHIQAGLPTLAPAELSWCAELTETLGVGLSFRHGDFDRLPELLAGFDRARCLRAMDAARERLGIGPHAAALAEFLRRAAGLPDVTEPVKTGTAETGENAA
jgi:hypothetical protein